MLTEAEEESYQPTWEVRKITPSIVQRKYDQIRQAIQDLKDTKVEKVRNDPGLKPFGGEEVKKVA